MVNTFTLREWLQEDAQTVAAAANNPKIAANLRNVFPHPYNLKDAENYLEDCISRNEKQQITRAIDVNGKAVGSIGIFVKDDIYEKSAELGYWLSEEYWNQGIMTGAIKQICEIAFKKFDIIRIFAEPFEYNIGSRRALEKAGFAYEGTMKNGVCKNGKIFSYCMYALLKQE